jgi:hypothetical protein
MNDLKKYEIKRGLEEAIKNCNRNIYEWVEKSKRGARFTISHTEIHGLVRNWVIRRLKDVLGAADADRVLRQGNLCVSVNPQNNSISRLYLTGDGDWSEVKTKIKVVKDAMSMIDYEAQRYDPKDYKLDGITPLNSHSFIDHPMSISFDSIKNVKF